jgi:5-methyltetrahydropteroyltriglutamate--homocysteine methyltransferase
MLLAVGIDARVRQTRRNSNVNTILPTSLVGSYPQPDWLIDRERLRAVMPPRVRARELWRIEPQWLEEAQDDATLVAVRDQERAGLDVITDGEMRRESYSNRFATAIRGVDIDNPGSTIGRTGEPTPVPRISGPLHREGSVQVRDVQFLRAATDRTIKMTVPGPFTMAQQAQNEHYEREEDLAFAFADVVREEIAELFAAGADIVQLDEPWMEARPDAARRYGLETLQRALDGVQGTKTLHICFGYPLFVPDHPTGYQFLTELASSPVDQISIETAQSNLDVSVLSELGDKTVILGVIALDSPEVETPEVVAERIGRALVHKPVEQLVAAPDCGMKYLPRDAAYAKLESLVAGAKAVREASAAAA